MASGTARLMLGGPDGRLIDVKAGDVLVLPAGTGHRRIDASENFLVVGAYPVRQVWDICRNAPSDETRQRMRALPMPEQDPAFGEDGPLTEQWPCRAAEE